MRNLWPPIYDLCEIYCEIHFDPLSICKCPHMETHERKAFLERFLKCKSELATHNGFELLCGKCFENKNKCKCK